MPHKPKIPPQVLERFHRNSDPVPKGGGRDLTRCPACAFCTLCCGLHVVTEETAQHWSIRNAVTIPPTSALPELPETLDAIPCAEPVKDEEEPE
jgi:hypothetical protein